VTLKSGGYIVINQTEALVSIDVNSGRATREHSIEETARKTNLEAASEVARQLRLRDLAGLIVIDFIDMEEGRNDREVEKRLRDAVKNDRARVQLGKISQFGLLEMSRQRLRAGVVASSTMPCPHCGGVGLVRSVESSALRLLRALEEEGEKNRAAAVTVRTAGATAIYILNQKRHELDRIETEHGMTIGFVPQEGMAAGSFEIERTKSRDPSERPRHQAVGIEAGFLPPDESEPEIVEEEDEIEEEEVIAEPASEEAAGDAGERPREREGRKRRRRGGRGRGRDRDSLRAESPAAANEEQQAAQGISEGEPIDDHADAGPQNDAQAGEGGEPRRRRRRRRGRRGGRDRDTDASPAQAPSAEPAPAKAAFAPVSDRFGSAPDEIDTTPSDDRHAPGTPSAPVWTLKDEEPDTTPRDESKPAKKGWWQRTFSGGE
jgi:ribonuclease E